MSKIVNLVGYFLKNLSRIFFFEFDYKIDYFLGNVWSANFSSTERTVILLSDEFVIVRVEIKMLANVIVGVAETVFYWLAKIFKPGIIAEKGA